MTATSVPFGPDRSSTPPPALTSGLSLGSRSVRDMLRLVRALCLIPWVKFEFVLADAQLVAGLESGVAERRQHPHLGEPLLEVGERLGIGEVVALEEHLD